MNTPAATRPFSPRIDRNYPKPRLKLPAGACDCHFHFIGPQQQFTLKPNGSLRDISPTLLGMLGVDEPREMTGTDLRVPLRAKIS